MNTSDWNLIPLYRHNRNFIRPGDIVKCHPVSGVSFRATVQYIKQRDSDGEIEITVVGGRSGVKQWRTFNPDRITRLAQSRLETVK